MRFPDAARWRAAICATANSLLAANVWEDSQRNFATLASAELPLHPLAAKVHLRQILPSIAVALAAREHRLPAEDARAVIRDVAFKNAMWKSIFLRVLKYLPGAFLLFRLVTPRVLHADYLSAGFKVSWIENSSRSLAFDVTRCLYVDLFEKYDVRDIAPIFCEIDDLWYAPLAPRIGWCRTGTIAEGADRCDFKFCSKTHPCQGQQD